MQLIQNVSNIFKSNTPLIIVQLVCCFQLFVHTGRAAFASACLHVPQRLRHKSEAFFFSYTKDIKYNLQI